MADGLYDALFTSRARLRFRRQLKSPKLRMMERVFECIGQLVICADWTAGHYTPKKTAERKSQDMGVVLLLLPECFTAIHLALHQKQNKRLYCTSDMQVYSATRTRTLTVLRHWFMSVKNCKSRGCTLLDCGTVAMALYTKSLTCI